jgi:hypothetical protein
MYSVLHRVRWQFGVQADGLSWQETRRTTVIAGTWALHLYQQSNVRLRRTMNTQREVTPMMRAHERKVAVENDVPLETVLVSSRAAWLCAICCALHAGQRTAMHSKSGTLLFLWATALRRARHRRGRGSCSVKRRRLLPKRVARSPLARAEPPAAPVCPPDPRSLMTLARMFAHLPQRGTCAPDGRCAY